MKMLALFSKFSKAQKQVTQTTSQVMNVVNKVKSGVSSTVKSENITHPIGKFVGTFTIKAQKDLNVDEVRLSFNQYIYNYTHTGAYTWKEFFIGTQTLDGVQLRAGESKVLDFNIDYEFHMTEDEKNAATKKEADIKKIMSMGYFRKDGKGSGREWKFKLVAVIVLAGGEEVKEEHVVKIKQGGSFF